MGVILCPHASVEGVFVGSIDLLQARRIYRFSLRFTGENQVFLDTLKVFLWPSFGRFRDLHVPQNIRVTNELDDCMARMSLQLADLLRPYLDCLSYRELLDLAMKKRLNNRNFGLKSEQQSHLKLCTLCSNELESLWRTAPRGDVFDH